ncbi:MAG: radical SAM protein [Sulfolobales archaeon]
MGSSKKSSDPLATARLIEEKVTSRSLYGELLRKYYGFSHGSWYGGSFAGYVIGCNLDCVFCWAWFKNRFDLGFYLTPEEVARKLVLGSVETKARVTRISGGEPTICIDHLLEVMKDFSRRSNKILLVIETNGILLGCSDDRVGELGEFSEKNISIRVSLKGANPDTFSLLTGASKEYYSCQLSSIEKLVKAGFIPGRTLLIAVMSSFNKPREIAELIYGLSKIDEEIPKTVELEIVRLYKNVKKKLDSINLRPITYIEPDSTRK